MCVLAHCYIKTLYSKSQPVLIHVLELRVQRPLIFHPVGEDVSHGATVLVEAQVEAVGVDLGTVRDLEHRLEADPFLSCVKQERWDFVLMATTSHRVSLWRVQTGGETNLDQTWSKGKDRPSLTWRNGSSALRDSQTTDSNFS